MHCAHGADDRAGSVQQPLQPELMTLETREHDTGGGDGDGDGDGGGGVGGGGEGSPETAVVSSVSAVKDRL